jgi:hypothetical protein
LDWSSRFSNRENFLLLKLRNEANFPGMKLASQPVRRRRASAAPGGWSIVLVDGSAIRRKARRDYERVLRDLDAAKAEAERFEVEDKPQFARPARKAVPGARVGERGAAGILFRQLPFD